MEEKRAIATPAEIESRDPSGGLIVR
jgi:hypothetical protein